MSLQEQLARLRAAKGVELSGQPAQEATQTKGGFLRGLFNYLDLPGNVVQNILLNGNVEGAGRNLVDLVTKTATLGLAGTDLTREQDRPDVGLVGEILTDPLTWISFGGTGALGAAKAAGKTALQTGIKGLTRTGLKATMSAADDVLVKRLGKRALRMAGKEGSEAAVKEAGEKAVKGLVRRQADKLVASGLAKKAAQEQAELGVKKVAQRVAQRQVGHGIKKGVLPDFLQSVTRPLQTGGIQVGLPFTTGKTVALEGTDVIRKAAGFTLPGIAAKAAAKYAPQRTAKVVKGVKDVIRRFSPLAFASPEGQRIASDATNFVSDYKHKYGKRLIDALADVTPETRTEMTKAVGSADPERTIKALADAIQNPEEKAKVLAGLDEWRNITTEFADQLEPHGFWYDRTQLKGWHVPKQLARKEDKTLLEALAEGAKPTSRGSTEPKKFFLQPSTIDDISKLEGAELDLLNVGLQRISDQAELLAEARAVRQSNAVSAALPAAANAGRFVSPTPSVTQGQRLRSGTLMSRMSEMLPGLGRKAEVPVESLVRSNIDDAAAIQRARGFKADPSLPFRQTVQQADEVRQAAKQSQTMFSRRMRAVNNATEQFIPDDWRGAFTADIRKGTHAPLNIPFGFKDEAGNYLAKATLTKADDGSYVLSNLPRAQTTGFTKTVRDQVNALAAGAYRIGAEHGIDVRISNSAFQRIRPKLKTLVDTELHNYFKKGLGKVKSSPFFDAINNNKAMKIFRSSATVGIGPFVNPAFHTRNVVTGTLLQAFTDPQMGLSGFKHLRPILEGLIDKVGRKFGMKLKGGKVFKMLAEDAIQNGRNIGRTVSNIDDVRYGNFTGREVLKMAQEKAVIRQGYTGIEDVMDAASKAKVYWPQLGHQAGEYTENAMRLNAYAELLGKGVDADAAARSVSRMFVDYRYQSQSDKTVRSLFPFSRFTIAQTPVTLESVARSPRMTQPLRALMAGSTNTATPPWMADSPNIPIGTNEDGTQRVLSRGGLPFEDLSVLGSGEGTFRTIEQGVLGRLNPFLRIPLELTTNRSFFRGDNLGRSPRAPAAFPDFMVEAMGGKVNPPEKGGRRLPWESDMAFRNLPVSRQVNEISKLMDDRKDVWAKSLDFIAGVKLYDIDEDMELKRMIRDYLSEKAVRGDIGTVKRFFQYGDTDENLTQLIKDYYKIGKSTGKRRAQPPQTGATPTR